MWLQQAEHALVGIPAVENGIGSQPRKPGVAADALEQGAIGVAADDDAGLAVPGEQDAQPSRVEMERVGDGRRRADARRSRPRR